MAISALRRLCVPFLVVAFAIALLALSSGGSKAQWIPGTPQFVPDFDVKLCNDLGAGFNGPAALQGGGGACVPDTTPSGNPDTTIPFSVPLGHLAYDQSYFVTAGGADETRLDGNEIGGPNPDGTGAAAGGLTSDIMLGLAANPCATNILPDFIWWEAEYNVTDTVACQPEGASARWDPLMSDGADAWPGQADRNSLVVTKYPDCIMKMFDPDGDGIDNDGDPNTLHDQPVQPRARFAGGTQVPPGKEYQMLQNVEFSAGDLQKAFSRNPGTTQHPFAKLGPELGYVNVIILNDPTTIVLQPNPISDFCSPLGTLGMLKGVIDTGSGTVNRVTSPATPGSYMAQARTMSYRDADGDGIENNYDTCAWTANTAAESPWLNAGPDTDMLDSACDPFAGAKNDDEDGDGYINSQDWCPLAGNPITDVGPPPVGGERDGENSVPYNTGAPDGGPRQDSIGDDCDSENGGTDTESDGLYFNAIYVDSVCITTDPAAGGAGPDDADGDGWCNDIDGVLAGSSDAVFDDIGVTYSRQMPDATDPDGDDDQNSAPYALANSSQEWAVGTDPLNDCALISGHDTWPPDFDINGEANILDIVQLTPPTFGKLPPDPNYVTRKDLNADGEINILDIVQLTPPVFGTVCSD